MRHRLQGPAARSSAVLLTLLLTVASARADNAPQAPAEKALVEKKPSPLEPVREAQRRFTLGVTLYGEGDLRGALAEFRRAHQIFPSYKVLYNLGTVSRELFDWAAALAYYREYLAEGGEAITAERRLQIERQVLELAQRVGRLYVVVKDGPAEVALDEQPVVLRPDSALLVNPGKRRLKVSYAGRPSVVRVVEVVSGDQNRVVVERPTTVLKGAKLPTAGPLDPSAPARAAPQEASHAAWWTWGAAAVAAGGALTLGLTARQSSQMLATERTRFPANPGNLADLSGRTRKLALAADVLAASTSALAALATYLSFTGPARVQPEHVALAWRF
jgi:hypothetical protein